MTRINGFCTSLPDSNRFLSRRRARENVDVRARHGKCLGEKSNHFRIRFAVFRRSREINFYTAVGKLSCRSGTRCTRAHAQEYRHFSLYFQQADGIGKEIHLCCKKNHGSGGKEHRDPLFKRKSFVKNQYCEHQCEQWIQSNNCCHDGSLTFV